MNEIEIKPCPMCGCRAQFVHGGEMTNGKRIVKVRCVVGCIEQTIFHCDELDAARSWNIRAVPPAQLPPLPEGCAPKLYDVGPFFDEDDMRRYALAALAKARGAA